MLKILVRGSGDVGSAVALSLFEAGYAVIIHDDPLPSATRRKMAFTDAIFDGHTSLMGVTGQIVDAPARINDLLFNQRVIPVSTAVFSELLTELQPNVVVDARMRKHSQPEVQISHAPLTIGLGPNFIAGETVHLVVETARGKTLGQVISQGASAPLSGEPVEIAGHSRDRYVYAPAAGVFHTFLKVGDAVRQGQEVARLDEVLLLAPVSGLIRGLTHDGVPVGQNTKVIEVDPRFDDAQISGVSERSASIAAGVLTAIKTWGTTYAD